MRSRSNGGVIGAYQLPTQNYANGVFFIHDAAIYNTGANPIWPLASGFIYSATGGTITTAVDNSNYKVHTFTANGTFTVETGSGMMEILLVGGGGVGGSVLYNAANDQAAGGGGGGGNVTLVNTWVEPGTTFTVTVAKGGTNPRTGTSADVSNRYNGGSSIVSSTAGHSYVSRGGGAGGGFYTSVLNYRNGEGSSIYTGGGGGASVINSSNGTGGVGAEYVDPGYTVYSKNGAAGSYNTYTHAVGGGGGGAGANGNPANVQLAGYGGDGWLWSRTNAYYGPGGGGGGLGTGGLGGPYPGTREGNGKSYGTTGNGTSGTGDNYGRGGGAAYAANESTSGSAFGGQGGPGMVIFCYRYR